MRRKDSIKLIMTNIAILWRVLEKWYPPSMPPKNPTSKYTDDTKPADDGLNRIVSR
jgi:hypothetical protein